jgi:hypothetical protein
LTSSNDLVTSANLVAGSMDVVDASSLVNNMLSDAGGVTISSLSGNGSISGNLYIYSSTKVYAGTSRFTVAYDGISVNATLLPASTFDFITNKVMNVVIEPVSPQTRITVTASGHAVFTWLQLLFSDTAQVSRLTLDWNGSLVEMIECLIQASQQQVFSWMEHIYVIVICGVILIVTIVAIINRNAISRCLRCNKRPVKKRSMHSNRQLLE